MRDVACPFCGLLCDDLVYDRNTRRLDPACPKAQAALERLQGAPPAPRVRGRDTDLSQAVHAAAALLRQARQPVVAGFATDVSGARALVSLADRCGAVTDHYNGQNMLRNLLAFHTAGWNTTTLSEVKNRADLIVIVGTDIPARMPRFLERVVWGGDTLFGLKPAARQLVLLGEGIDAAPLNAPDGREAEVIPAQRERLGEAMACMSALLAEQPLQCDAVAGVPVDTWRALNERILASSYCVFVWAAGDLAMGEADLTVQALGRLIRQFNRTTRVAGLPLGGDDGDLTANAVHLWQVGYSLRTRFAGGTARYEPVRLGAPAMLERGEADCLLWVSSFDARRGPPTTDVPTIVLGVPGEALAREPEVYIPVGTPGVDHAGQLVRTDQVVMVPVRALRAAGLPSVAQVAASIETALTRREGPA